MSTAIVKWRAPELSPQQIYLLALARYFEAREIDARVIVINGERARRRDEAPLRRAEAKLRARQRRRRTALSIVDAVANRGRRWLEYLFDTSAARAFSGR
jgi:hypothetical protein